MPVWQAPRSTRHSGSRDDGALCMGMGACMGAWHLLCSPKLANRPIAQNRDIAVLPRDAPRACMHPGPRPHACMHAQDLDLKLNIKPIFYLLTSRS